MKNDVTLKSTIAHHSSYIPETKKILKEYSELKSYEKLRNKVFVENMLNKSSESYRKMLFNEVLRRYMPKKDVYEKTPLMKILDSDLIDTKKDWFIYYEFCKDPLIYEIVTSLIYQRYDEGMSGINNENVIEFVNKLKEDYPEVKDWSESTVLHIGQQLLAALKNFGILEGSKRKKFKYLSPPRELIVYVIYSIREDGVELTSDIMDHDDWRLLMLDKGRLRSRLREIAPEHIIYEKRGSVEQIDFKYENLEECVDALGF